MARNDTFKFLRTTRASLNTQRTASALLTGEPYLIIDEGRFAVATDVNAYQDFNKVGEWPQRGSNANGEWVKFEDGTMLQYGVQLVNQSVAAGAAAIPSVTLPQTFVAGAQVGSSELVFYAAAGQTGSALYASRQSYSIPYVGIFINTGWSPSAVVPSFTTLGTTTALSYRFWWNAIGRWK